jgi:hypothetical protein
MKRSVAQDPYQSRPLLCVCGIIGSSRLELCRAALHICHCANVPDARRRLASEVRGPE